MDVDPPPPVRPTVGVRADSRHLTEFIPPPDDPLAAKLREALAPNLLLVKRVGVGGMAEVFLAREPALKRLVAVKVLAGEIASTAQGRQRFEREAQAVAGLSHPNIVAVHSVGELDDETPYFVMQYVEGRSVAARVEEAGPLSVPEAKRLLGEVAAALAAAHKQGIIHRDIKPANILLEEATGRSLVSDFGIAAIGPNAATQSVRITSTGILVGTPQYMSPEQLLAEPVTEKTDVYSLGLLAHEVLVGSGPFRGKTPQELIAAHLRDVPDRLSQRASDVDAELDELIARCLAKDASKRPTADEVARRLSPGGTALLEWPPPGLEELHGKLRGVSFSYLTASALIGLSMLSMVAAGPQLGFVLTSPITLLLFLAVIVGAAMFIVAIRRTVRVGRETARALANGYAWLTVLETSSDVRGDTGNIITGSREYAALSPDERDRFRQRRMARECLFLGGGFSTIPLLLLALILGSGGHAGINAIWLAAALPALAVVGAVALDSRERRAFAVQRRRPPGRATDVSKLSLPWYESFESVRVGQALGRGVSSAHNAGRVGALLAAALTVVVIVMLLPLVLVGTVGPVYWSLAIPKFANTRAKFEIAVPTRAFQVAKDPRITPLEAGRAFYALVESGADHKASGFAEHAVPATFPDPVWNAPPPSGLFPTATPDATVGIPSSLKIIKAGSRGFSPAEMAFLERLAHDVRWKSVATVARARSMDYLGARFVVPFPEDSPGAWALPIPHFAATKALAYASVSRAAYYLARGQRDSAETSIEEIISFGFVIADNGTTLIEQLIGVVIASIGYQGLIDFYAAVGDPRGLVLRAKHDSVVAAIENRTALAGRSGEASSVDLRAGPELRSQIRATANDPTQLRGLRMEMLYLLARAPCTNVRELVLGPDADVQASFAGARKTWVRFSSDSATLNLIYRVSEQPGSSVWPSRNLYRIVMRMAQVEGALLRNKRLPGCVATLLNPDS